MEAIILIIYAILGTKAVRYCKRHILGITMEFTFDVGKHKVKEIALGMFFGFLLIPVMIIHSLLFRKK